MQVAGTKCAVCGHGITLASEGKFCGRCGTVAHPTCEPREACSKCGQPYQKYERPTADPLSDALLPLALRPARSGGPILAISVAVGFALLTIAMWYAIIHLQSQGH